MSREPTSPRSATGRPAPPSASAGAEATPADVRIFTWTLAVVGCLAAVIVAGSIAWRARQARQAAEPDTPRQLVDFRLVERSGRPVARAELSGKILVVNFVFTGCALTCFEVSRHMAEVQRRLADRPDVQLVSISVDPRTDTPEVLSAFAARLAADPQRWWFLTGPKDEVYQLIETSFLRREVASGPVPEGAMPGGFERAERIALVTGEGRIVRYFNGLRPGVAAEIVEAVRALPEKGKVSP